MATVKWPKPTIESWAYPNVPARMFQGLGSQTPMHETDNQSTTSKFTLVYFDNSFPLV